MFKPVINFCLATHLLIGCGSVTPAGLIAAARLDPIETPPSDIAIAISVPEILRLNDGDAMLFLGFAPDDADPIGATVPLTISTEPGPQTPDAGEAIYVFAFSVPDAAELSAIQAQIRALKAEDTAGTGTLSVQINGGCLTDDLPERLQVATWIRTSPTQAFVSLTRQTDFLEALPEQERVAFVKNLQAC